MKKIFSKILDTCAPLFLSCFLTIIENRTFMRYN